MQMKITHHAPHGHMFSSDAFTTGAEVPVVFNDVRVPGPVVAKIVKVEVSESSRSVALTLDIPDVFAMPGLELLLP